MTETARSKQECATSGLVLMKKPVQRALLEVAMVREGSTGRVITLERVWAVAEAETAPQNLVRAETGNSARPKAEVAFYRKYTEAMLRRYLRLSLEAGRVPSLMGKEMFRGHVTSYRVRSFEDVVIFCHDVETCLARLNGTEQDLIRRVALQEYSQGEAAAVLGTSTRSVVRQYAAAIDRLTTMFVEREMLEPLKSCQ